MNKEDISIMYLELFNKIIHPRLYDMWNFNKGICPINIYFNFLSNIGLSPIGENIKDFIIKYKTF